MKKNLTSFKPLSTRVCGSQFSTLKSFGFNDSKEPEKYSKIEMMYGAPFCGCHTTLYTCCCDV
jgi:hypothetical protein